MAKKGSQQRSDRRRYNVQRTLLILLMGSKCSYCQERRPWVLEFHHVVRSKVFNGHAGKTSRKKRIRNYMREWLDGVCVLSCSKCNKQQGVPPDPDEKSIPF